MPDIYGEKTFEEIVQELQFLNPKANIKLNATGDEIVSDVSVFKLSLPRDFYVTRNNNISNRGNTESGMYWTLPVQVNQAEMTRQPRASLLTRLKQGLFTSRLKTQDTQVTPDCEM